jgi:uncharacterized protein (DUF1697 family)
VHRYIAFLRAINVGGHMVKMDQLRALFAELKLRNVETLIASGNVIFEAASPNADALEQRIERHLKTSLGYEVATFLRSPAEIAAIVAHRAFPTVPPDSTDHALWVGFLKSAPNPAAWRRLREMPVDGDEFHTRGREVYWLRHGGRFSDSKFSGATFEKVLSLPATFRNVTTVRKLAAKYPDQERR